MAICPFCGVAADAPHDTQEGCIEALHAEIARMRSVLGQVHSARVPGPAQLQEDEPDHGPESGD